MRKLVTAVSVMIAVLAVPLGAQERAADPTWTPEEPWEVIDVALVVASEAIL